VRAGAGVWGENPGRKPRGARTRSIKRTSGGSAELYSGDLRGADLAGPPLSGARYDRRTLWPGGFDPQESGAVREWHASL
jgi:hypothetical protein